MPDTTLPKPLSAYVGLVLASLEEARAAGQSTVGQVARLPLAAASQLLTARHHYDELAEQGDAIVGLVVGIVRERFGAGGTEADDWIGDELSGTRSNFSNGVLKDLAGGLESTADRLTAKAEELESSFERQEAIDLDATIDLDEPAPEPTPLQQIEQFSVPEEIGAQAGGLKSAADLPLDDFDHMSAPQLRGRLRSLDRVQLVQLLDYERAHADRVGIVLMLENRLAKLIAADQ